jgi:prepilin-type N-terminal cleavage/methylation domain-containing protein
MSQKGFTLIELVVVIFLIGIVFSITFPRIQDAVLRDHLKTATRRMIGTIKAIKHNAVREQRDYSLHFSFSNNSFWIESPEMSTEERIRARRNLRRLPSGIDVLNVWSAKKGILNSNEATIRFSKKGYVSPAFIRIASDKGRNYTLFLSPFLDKITLVDQSLQ